MLSGVTWTVAKDLADAVSHGSEVAPLRPMRVTWLTESPRLWLDVAFAPGRFEDLATFPGYP